MRNDPYPTGGRLAANEEEHDAGLVNIPATEQTPAQFNTPNPNMSQVHDIKVNNETRQVTTAQLIEMAQKGQAAEQRFQEAASLRKENAEAITLREDLKSVFDDGDADAFRRLGASMGVPLDQVEEITQRTFGEDNDDDGDVVESYERELESRNPSASHPAAPSVIDYSHLSPDVQRALREVETRRIEKIVNTALDSDEVVRYNMDRYDDKGQNAIRQFVDEKIRGRLDAHGGDFGDGTRILAEILPEIRDHLQALGTPNARNSMSLGNAPGGSNADVYPTKKPDHVSSQSGDAFEQNILETMMFHQRNAESGR